LEIKNRMNNHIHGIPIVRHLFTAQADWKSFTQVQSKIKISNRFINLKSKDKIDGEAISIWLPLGLNGQVIIDWFAWPDLITQQQ
jgi:hypothetical protein